MAIYQTQAKVIHQATSTMRNIGETK